MSAPAAFGVALNLPLDHTRATFAFDGSASPPAGILVPVGGPLSPGTGATATLGGKQALAGPLADQVTIGVARRKSVVTDGDVSLPAGALLFSIAFDVAIGAQSGTLFDGPSAGFGKARLAVLKKDGTEAASKADFAVGQLFVTQ